MSNKFGLHQVLNYNIQTLPIAARISANLPFGDPHWAWSATRQDNDDLTMIAQATANGLSKSKDTNRISEYIVLNADDGYPYLRSINDGSTCWGHRVLVSYCSYPAGLTELGTTITLNTGGSTNTYRLVLTTKADDCLYFSVEQDSKNINGSILKSVEVKLFSGVTALIAASAGLLVITMRAFVGSGSLQFEVSQRGNYIASSPSTTTNAILPDFVYNIGVINPTNFKIGIFYRTLSTTADSPIFTDFFVMGYGFDIHDIYPTFTVFGQNDYEFIQKLSGLTNNTFSEGFDIYKYYIYNNQIQYQDRDNNDIILKTLQIITDNASAFVNIDGRFRVLNPNTVFNHRITKNLSFIGVGCLGGDPQFILSTEE